MALRASASLKVEDDHGTFEIRGPYDVPGLSVPRHVRIYRPPRFDARPARRTLYMFDGQNMFHDEPSFAGGWHLHKTVDRLSRRTAGAPAVVGIDHGGAARIDELGPWREGDRGGKTDALLEWVVETLVPDLERELRLSPRPEDRVIGGSSLGGLAALYAHFRHPSVFGGAMCLSPSFWFAHGHIFDFVANRSAPRASRIYMDCGAREGGQMIALASRMAEHLRRRGYGPDRLLWRPITTGIHSERHWRRRIPRALGFVFLPVAPARAPARRATA